MTITGLQQAGAHVEAQLAFEAPQHPLWPSSPASAKLAMLIAASTAPVILIHLIELASPSLGNFEPGSSKPMERRCRSVEEFQAAFSAARDARRSSNGCCRHLVPVATTVKRTSVHRQFRPAEPQTPHPPHSSCCSHIGCPATVAFGGTRPMNRRDRHDALNLSNRYFVTDLRRFFTRVSDV